MTRAAEVLRLHEAGQGQSAIAKQLAIPRQAVHYELSKLGLTAPQKSLPRRSEIFDLRQAGHAPATIARLLDISRQVICSTLSRHAKRLAADKVHSTPLDRLNASYAIDGVTGCHVWSRHRLSSGYGRFTLNGKHVLAHRASYEFSVGPIPDGLVLDHLCRNRACVNPTHLEAVTQRVNTLRGIGPTARRAQQTHCGRGHEFTAENTKFARATAKRGPYRICRTCAKARPTHHSPSPTAAVATSREEAAQPLGRESHA